MHGNRPGEAQRNLLVFGQRDWHQHLFELLGCLVEILFDLVTHLLPSGDADIEGFAVDLNRHVVLRMNLGHLPDGAVDPATNH